MHSFTAPPRMAQIASFNLSHAQAALHVPCHIGRGISLTFAQFLYNAPLGFALQELVAGGVVAGGVWKSIKPLVVVGLANTFVAPLERVKVLFQVKLLQLLRQSDS